MIINNKKMKMKRTTIIRYAIGTFVLLIGFTSCGVYSGMVYDDGIYGDETPRTRYYESPEDIVNHSPETYRERLNQKIAGYRDFQQEAERPAPAYTPLTNIDSYRTPAEQNRGSYNTYGSWGENARPTSVNVYNNYGGWGYPYYNSPYYWGSGAWGGYYSSSYYYPRSGWGWGISVGSYDPYWSWRYYDSYYYPYYGYYSPYYYSPYYYSPYYYNYPRYHYNRENNYYYYSDPYGNTSRRYSPTNGRRGDSSRYEDYNYQRGTSRSYGNYNNSYDSSSRSYHENTNRTYDSSRNYNNYNNNYDNSSRSYQENNNYGGENRNNGGFQGTGKNF